MDRGLGTSGWTPAFSAADRVPGAVLVRKSGGVKPGRSQTRTNAAYNRYVKQIATMRVTQAAAKYGECPARDRLL
jgi:hypothetical protein